MRILVNCTESEHHTALKGKYSVRGYPTVLFLNSRGDSIETLGSRCPGDVVTQMRRIFRDQDPSAFVAEALRGHSGAPWDWVRAQFEALDSAEAGQPGSARSRLAELARALETALVEARDSADLEASLRAGRILELASPDARERDACRLPLAIETWLLENVSALGDDSFETRERSSAELSAMRRVLDLADRLARRPSSGVLGPDAGAIVLDFGTHRTLADDTGRALLEIGCSGPGITHFRVLEARLLPARVVFVDEAGRRSRGLASDTEWAVQEHPEGFGRAVETVEISPAGDGER